MNIQVLKAMRAMTGDKVPVVDMREKSHGTTLYSAAYVDMVLQYLIRDLPDFVELYQKRATKDAFTLEDVFDTCVSCEFGEIVKMRGVDILYSNMNLHLRIVVDGVDKPTDHYNVLSSRDFITHYDGSTVVIHLARFVLNGNDEYWEYYIAM